MTKRKRDSEDVIADVGLGETLARLKEEAQAEPNPTPATDDSEGWTVVQRKSKTRKLDDLGGSRSDHATHSQKSSSFKQETGKEDQQKQDRVERRKQRKLDRHYPSIEHSHHARLQSHVKIADLQALILYILADGTAPQWISVASRNSINKVVVLMVPGLELDMFNGKLSLDSKAKSSSSEKTHDGSATPPSVETASTKLKRIHISPDDYYPAPLKLERVPAPLKPLCDIFSWIWPIKAPGDYRGNQYFRVHSPMHTMLTSQIPRSKEEKELKKNTKGPILQNSKHWDNKRTPITQYIASLMELEENEFVIHPAWYTTPEAKEAAYERRKSAKQTCDDGWVDTEVTSLAEGEVPEAEVEQGSVTAGRSIYTVDCEMCKSEEDKFVLTRISLLDWNGEVVLDKLVKPDVPIKDYLTQYSGITAAMLEDVTTTLADVQRELVELFTPRAILIGHSLNSDLNALQLTHPFLVDTGILYPHMRGPPYKQSLKFLATKFLGKEIQKGSKGHDSVEDALTTLNLVKQKCERGPRWGTGETNSESIFKRLSRTTRPKASSANRSGAVVDWGEPRRGYGGQAQVAIGCKSDEEVVDGINIAVNGQAEGKDGTTEEVDLVWGRLRNLELARGWWDDTKSADVEVIRQAALQRLRRPDDSDAEATEAVGSELGEVVTGTVSHIQRVYESLPPCTAFIVYSGTGDPREIRRLQAMRSQHQREYQTKNWDNLSVKWTDTEVQALSRACQSARDGIGFVVVK